jgi:hypothetical protein
LRPQPFSEESTRDTEATRFLELICRTGPMLESGRVALQLRRVSDESVDTERKSAIDRAEAAGYLPLIRALAKSSAVPVWWWRNSIPLGDSILHNGTLTAVDTGAKTICVTAGHVYEQYVSDIEEYADVECQIGNVRVRLEEWLIAHDPSVDLATFEMSSILVAGSGVRAQAARTWPPSNLREKDIVVLGGYPGSFRTERPGAVDSSFVSFFAPVAQASEEHSAFQLNLRDSYWPDGSGGIPERSELGGMSGGPIFRYHSEPIEFLELAGFIYEANAEFELIRGRHASTINAVGNIVRGV